MYRDLTRGSILRSLLLFALPMLAGDILQQLYNIADTLIVSRAIGRDALAAVGSAYTLMIFLTSILLGLSMGAGALFSNCRGRGDESGLRQGIVHAFGLIGVCTLLLTALAYALLPALLRLLQVPESVSPLMRTYLAVIFAGIPATFLYNFFACLLRSVGNSMTPLVFSGISALGNVALDLLFVLVFPWGVAGAAWATVAGYCVGGIIPLVFFITHRSGLHLTGTKLYIREFWQACGNGASELMSNISSSLVGILYNLELMRLVGERGVAAHSVMMYVDFVFIAAFLGFSIGSAPIISYHFGAENHDELKNVFRRSMFLILVTSGAMVVLSEALCRPLCAAFVGYSPDLMQLTVHGFRLFALCYLFCGVNIYASAFFTALCNGALSAFISFLRSLLLRGGLVLLLPPVLGLDGVWLAVVAAEGLSAAVSAVLLRRQRTRYHYL